MTSTLVSLAKERSSCTAGYELMNAVIAEFRDEKEIYDTVRGAYTGAVSDYNSGLGLYNQQCLQTACTSPSGGYDPACPAHCNNFKIIHPQPALPAVPATFDITFGCTVCEQNIDLTNVQAGRDVSTQLSQAMTCATNIGQGTISSYETQITALEENAKYASASAIESDKFAKSAISIESDADAKLTALLATSTLEDAKTRATELSALIATVSDQAQAVSALAKHVGDLASPSSLAAIAAVITDMNAVSVADETMFASIKSKDLINRATEASASMTDSLATIDKANNTLHEASAALADMSARANAYLTGLQLAKDAAEAATIEAAMLTADKHNTNIEQALADAKEAADAAAKHAEAARIIAFNANYDLTKNGATAAKKNMSGYKTSVLKEAESANTAAKDAQNLAIEAAQIQTEMFSLRDSFPTIDALVGTAKTVAGVKLQIEGYRDVTQKSATAAGGYMQDVIASETKAIASASTTASAPEVVSTDNTSVDADAGDTVIPTTPTSTYVLYIVIVFVLLVAIAAIFAVISVRSKTSAMKMSSNI